MTLYVAFWMALSIVTVLVAAFYIPYYLQKNLSSNVIKMAEAGSVRKHVNIKRMLLGCAGTTLTLLVAVVSNSKCERRGFPLQMYAATFSLNLVLVYFILDHQVLSFLKRKVLLYFPSWKLMMRGAAVENVT